jgi:hypothetical protein
MSKKNPPPIFQRISICLHNVLFGKNELRNFKISSNNIISVEAAKALP